MTCVEVLTIIISIISMVISVTFSVINVYYLRKGRSYNLFEEKRKTKYCLCSDMDRFYYSRSIDEFLGVAHASSITEDRIRDYRSNIDKLFSNDVIGLFDNYLSELDKISLLNNSLSESKSILMITNDSETLERIKTELGKEYNENESPNYEGISIPFSNSMGETEMVDFKDKYNELCEYIRNAKTISYDLGLKMEHEIKRP